MVRWVGLAVLLLCTVAVPAHSESCNTGLALLQDVVKEQSSMDIRLNYLNSVTRTEYDQLKSSGKYSALIPDFPGEASYDIFLERLRSLNQETRFNYAGTFRREYAVNKLTALGASAYEECLRTQERNTPGFYLFTKTMASNFAIVKALFVGFKTTQTSYVTGTKTDFGDIKNEDIVIRSNDSYEFTVPRSAKEDHVFAVYYTTEKKEPPVAVTIPLARDYENPPPPPFTLVVVSAGGGARDNPIVGAVPTNNLKAICEGTTTCEFTVTSQLMCNKPDCAPGQSKKWDANFRCGLTGGGYGQKDEPTRFRVKCSDKGLEVVEIPLK
jgi:hypothetical protein